MAYLYFNSRIIDMYWSKYCGTRTHRYYEKLGYSSL
jgi:hypothetical protein